MQKEKKKVHMKEEKLMEEFFFMLWMSSTIFEELLKMVAPSITKSSMKREAISAEEILSVKLCYLASGDSYLVIYQDKHFIELGYPRLATL